MNAWAETARRLLPGLWAGALLCIALLATPAPFATLSVQDAGRVVARIFAQEAWFSLLMGAALLALERRHAAARAVQAGGSQFSTGMVLALGAIFCTVLGYFGLQPMMAQARAGAGPLSFGQLHAISFGLFGLKIVCAAVLAWRVAAPR